MSASDDDRTASLMTPAKLAQMKARPRAPASPAAYLDQMAADAGSGHVRRLVELRQQLEALLRGREGGLRTIAGSCQGLHDALARLDFSQVQPKGWLARATGKGKEGARQFEEQHQRVMRSADDLGDEVKTLQKQLAGQGNGLDRMVLEFEAEMRALEKIMDQGARWLQDMRNQIKARQAAGSDPAAQQQAREDAARCELLVTRLKLLRDVNTASAQALERSKAAAARRSAVGGTLQQVLDTEWSSARKRLGVVADEVIATGAATQGIDKAESACKALQTALQQAAQDCGAVQAVEQAASDEVAALQGPLQAAA